MIFVMARNYKEYINWLHCCDPHPTFYSYVYDVSSLRGHSHPQIIRLEGWDLNPRYDDNFYGCITPQLPIWINNYGYKEEEEDDTFLDLFKL